MKRVGILGVSVAVALAMVILTAGTAEAQTVYACVNNSSGTVKIVSATTVCNNNETFRTWPGALPVDSYGVGTVTVKRGAADPGAVWASYSTRLGSPVGADLLSIGGDTAGGVFRFTCRDTHIVCELSVAAATLADTAGQTVYVYPRVLMQRQSYTSAGPQNYCEYGDGSTGASAVSVPTQVSSSTPTYTPLLINIGGSADCSGPVTTAGDVSVITVGPGYYDVFTTFLFKKP